MVAVPALGACAGPQSILDPAGPAACDAAGLWWGMFAVAVVVLLGVTATWIVGMGRRPPTLEDAREKRVVRRWIVLGGVLLPSSCIVVLLVFGIAAGRRMLPLPRAGEAPLRIDVTARQWRWEVRYGGGAALINELRLPAGRPVDVHVQSLDVIHSFWVPRLGGKIDAIPGRTNVVRLQADAAGEYRGQCAEFCGTRHALMVLRVTAMEAGEFAGWLEAASR
ncbi:MAG: cytochrome c oxidase subunit II [Aromatoleum sp.]|uniref:cytochrome c oxidase subunit II n=1 Tax=Aromatoleum sp. TaxID=2307007 RepID=UPI002893F7CE|nr:cytochrome c oxidase subunit II [Aromatoleum sp.]MDT3671115.1 cytochrome c oxidase subunit II [Aromatoleum sp.]